MQESGRRRIQRALLIDVRSLAPLTETQIRQLRENSLYRPVLEKLLAELSEGERPLNLAAYRLCISAFLRTIPEIDTSRTLIVRERESNGYGIPLEIYLFTTYANWVSYEEFSAALADRLIAKLSEFGLRLYQKI